MGRPLVLFLLCAGLLTVVSAAAAGDGTWSVTMYADKELQGKDAPLQGKKDPTDCQKVPKGFTPSSFQMDVGPDGECFSILNFFKDENCKTKPLGSFKCTQHTLKDKMDDKIRSVAFAGSCSRKETPCGGST